MTACNLRQTRRQPGRHTGRRRQPARGIAVIEFAILLPIFIFMTLPVIDFARAIQANLILINLTREGASLASRSSQLPQTIMDSLAQTTPPLKMGQRGMIYITKVMGNAENCNRNGNNCTVRNIVLEQHRWTDGWGSGGSAPGSKVYGCASFSSGDGACRNLPTPGTSSPTANAMTGKLTDGQVIYVVESYYNFEMLFQGLTMGVLRMPTLGPNLYSSTTF
ncbi:TadE family protein [Cupriavidus agavae]|uniref:Flp pilus assembly protein TadG n=1 Tax=Cupriavidus agavae TaxID=1001822 RepID=A0A4Q7SAL1_9BURK|nr:TadE/TadG family type IV pilus assembly protein [Cupriavidus agavae]RZT42927.1 Flp pilus assembly protein TadG [Cupriavidus agavae]